MDWRFAESPRETTTACSVYKAHTRSDFQKVDAIWNTVYGRELGWLPRGRGAMYEDRYHTSSTYLLALVEGNAAGVMRLVSDSPHGLPVEQFVPLADLRRHRRLIECQRLMVPLEYRNQRWPELPHGVFAGLVKACLHWCLVNDVTHVLADVFLGTRTTPIAPLLAIGFAHTGKEFIDTELKEPDRSTALLLRVGDLYSRPFRTSNPFYRYLIEYDEAIDVYD